MAVSSRTWVVRAYLGYATPRMSQSRSWNRLGRKRLLRRSIASRVAVEARFHERGRTYDIRVTPQGPSRAIGVVRAALCDALAPVEESSDEPRWLGLDRRGFLRRLN